MSEEVATETSFSSPAVGVGLACLGYVEQSAIFVDGAQDRESKIVAMAPACLAAVEKAVGAVAGDKRQDTAQDCWRDMARRAGITISLVQRYAKMGVWLRELPELKAVAGSTILRFYKLVDHDRENIAWSIDANRIEDVRHWLNDDAAKHEPAAAGKLADKLKPPRRTNAGGPGNDDTTPDNESTEDDGESVTLYGLSANGLADVTAERFDKWGSKQSKPGAGRAAIWSALLEQCPRDDIVAGLAGVEPAEVIELGHLFGRVCGQQFALAVVNGHIQTVKDMVEDEDTTTEQRGALALAMQTLADAINELILAVFDTVENPLISD